MAEVARADPDGYTLALAPTGNLTVNQFLFKDLPFDVARDFQPVTVLATSPNVLVVHPSVPVKTFRELVAYAKANPGKLNFSSPGSGSGAHLAGELLNAEAGISAVHVPYKGMAPAVISDLLGGQVQTMFAAILDGAAARALRKARGARDREPRALVATAGRADGGGERASRIRRDVVVRHRRAQRQRGPRSCRGSTRISSKRSRVPT